MNIYSIYKITNTVNDKVYIGYTSKSIAIRFKRHVYASKMKQWNHLKLYKAFAKYGVDNFSCKEIYQSKDKLHVVDVMEQYFINEYDSIRCGYNIATGGQGGDIKSQDQKEKDSIRMKSNNPVHINGPWNKNVKGYKLPSRSEKYRIESSIRQRGIPKSESHKLAMRKPKIRCCRLLDRKEMSMSHFTRWINQESAM